MFKSVILKLVHIQYSGDSIGDDIRLEIEILGEIIRIDKKIKAGISMDMDQDIGSFKTDQKIFRTLVRITIIEKDLLFNDQGNVQDEIRVDTTLKKTHAFAFNVKVKESRSIFSRQLNKKTSHFTLTVEATISDSVQYVPDEADGWLKAVLEETKFSIDVPAFLQVKIDYTDSKREYFTLLEGPYRGKQASVKFKNDGTSQFVSGIRHEKMVWVHYLISKKTLFLNGKKYKIIDYSGATWKIGLYDIEIPDYAHRGGARYPEAKRAKTWFRIGHSGDKYLHTGGISLGCITVIEKKRWMEIYDTLINARKGDFMSVGILEVVE